MEATTTKALCRHCFSPIVGTTVTGPDFVWPDGTVSPAKPYIRWRHAHLGDSLCHADPDCSGLDDERWSGMCGVESHYAEADPVTQDDWR